MLSTMPHGPTHTLKADFDEAKQSQLPAAELLINLGYTYLSRAEVLRQREHDTTSFILKDVALERLMAINGYEQDGAWVQFAERDVREAIDRLEREPYEGLIDTAQSVYHTIMSSTGGMSIPVLENGRRVSRDFRFIDFQNPENNAFHVSVEYDATGKQTIRPDIVCFVNGIPFAVIENKKGSVPVEEAVNQCVRNWGPEYCPRLFTYAQLLVAMNGGEARYGVTGSPAKFFAHWKEKGVSPEAFTARIEQLIAKPIERETYQTLLKDLNGATRNVEQLTARSVSEQDRAIVSLLEPARMLQLIKHHVVFDAGVKKIARYQQFYAIEKMLGRIAEREGEKRKGGLVWHTQGSGKSLTMVLFVKALIEHPEVTNPRIVIVTDRRDLDKQLGDTFRACNLKKEVTRATTARHLLDLIAMQTPDVVTTLVQKFNAARHQKADFVDDSSDIFVLVDEAHRTQMGEMSERMRAIMPNACYIGFTGTPLMTTERESWRKFGGYIDKYTIDDALRDNIIVPLIYEGRYVDLKQNAKQIDRQVGRVTEDANTEQTQQIQRMIQHRIIQDNPSRIEEIAYDIQTHYLRTFKDTGLKGQIVAPSKYAAVQFNKVFQQQGKVQTAVVISDENGHIPEDDTHRQEVVQHLEEINANYRNLESYERQVIESFKHNEDGVELLIVVDKLLTGFDAPRNTVLYLAKDLKDHNLLQAIARVNRLFDNDEGKLQKTSGYIIDYSENAKNLKRAMQLFGNYDEADVKNALIDVHQKIDELQHAHSDLHEIFKELGQSRDSEAYLEHLADEQRRDEFYEAMQNFTRVFKECYALPDFASDFPEYERYQRELKKFTELSRNASVRYADRVDFGKYKQALVKILDQHVNAEGVELLTKQVSLSDTASMQQAVEELGSDKSKAEAIAAQTERTIEEEYDKDPEFYRSFSEKVAKILDEMREGKRTDAKALQELKDIASAVTERRDESVPETFQDKPAAAVFYRNLRETFAAHEVSESVVQECILDMYELIEREAIVDWYRNSEVKRVIANKLDDFLYDVVREEREVPLSNEEVSGLVSQAMELAEYNHELFRV